MPVRYQLSFVSARMPMPGGTPNHFATENATHILANTTLKLDLSEAAMHAVSATQAYALNGSWMAGSQHRLLSLPPEIRRHRTTGTPPRARKRAYNGWRSTNWGASRQNCQCCRGRIATDAGPAAIGGGMRESLASLSNTFSTPSAALLDPASPHPPRPRPCKPPGDATGRAACSRRRSSCLWRALRCWRAPRVSPLPITAACSKALRLQRRHRAVCGCGARSCAHSHSPTMRSPIMHV